MDPQWGQYNGLISYFMMISTISFVLFSWFIVVNSVVTNVAAFDDILTIRTKSSPQLSPGYRHRPRGRNRSFSIMRWLRFFSAFIFWQE